MSVNPKPGENNVSLEYTRTDASTAAEWKKFATFDIFTFRYVFAITELQAYKMDPVLLYDEDLDYSTDEFDEPDHGAEEDPSQMDSLVLFDSEAVLFDSSEAETQPEENHEPLIMESDQGAEGDEEDTSQSI